MKLYNESYTYTKEACLKNVLFRSVLKKEKCFIKVI